jgi:hypothetical protein
MHQIISLKKRSKEWFDGFEKGDCESSTIHNLLLIYTFAMDFFDENKIYMYQ